MADKQRKSNMEKKREIALITSIEEVSTLLVGWLVGCFLGGNKDNLKHRPIGRIPKMQTEFSDF